jgi:hypothetical protein
MRVECEKFSNPRTGGDWWFPANAAQYVSMVPWSDYVCEQLHKKCALWTDGPCAIRVKTKYLEKE